MYGSIHALRRRAYAPMRTRHSTTEFANIRPAIGDLRIEQLRDETLGRYVPVARLIDMARPRSPDIVEALYGPQLVAMSPLAFALSGFERIEGQEFAQSWLVREP